MNVTFLSSDLYRVDGLRISGLKDRTYCVFDLEGTGIDYTKEYITQIGAIRIERGTIPEGGRFSSLVRSPKPIPPAIERLTGITNADMARAPGFPEVYADFVRFAEDAVLVTQAGYEYDMNLLQKQCGMSGLSMAGNPVIDTKAMFTHIHPEIDAVVSTDFLLNYYRIDADDVPRHDALGDSVLIGRILLRILDEYRERGLDELDLTRGLTVRRFRLPPLATADTDQAGAANG
ncbi:MAG: polymerase epsilon subunit-like 3-5 exonuclease [Paenibacillus sp.]|jgi:DNA polymerase III alpha subunit (gram-positive type)|nr:polymerase epsilon subunit-like 3-5 exonuclease [Paenibacillus sp.]